MMCMQKLVKCMFCKKEVERPHNDCEKRKIPYIQFRGISFSRFRRNWQE